MEPGIDALSEKSEIATGFQQKTVEGKQDVTSISPSGQKTPPTSAPPHDRIRLLTNDLALEQMTFYQNHMTPSDPQICTTKSFKSWIEVIASGNQSLLSKTVQSTGRTLQYVIQSSRQQERLEQYWANLKEQFQRKLAEIQNKH